MEDKPLVTLGGPKSHGDDVVKIPVKKPTPSMGGRFQVKCLELKGREFRSIGTNQKAPWLSLYHWNTLVFFAPTFCVASDRVIMGLTISKNKNNRVCETSVQPPPGIAFVESILLY